jgi:hypothetical protein
VTGRIGAFGGTDWARATDAMNTAMAEAASKQTLHAAAMRCGNAISFMFDPP